MVFLPGVHVLCVRLVKQQLRDRPDKRPASGEHIQHGIPLFIEAHAVVQLHPSGDTPVVAPGEIDPVPQSRLINALPPAGIPDGRVGHPLDLPALQPGMGVLYPADFRELPLRRPPHAYIRLPGAAVQLQDPINDSVVVHRPPAAGEGLGIAEVITAVHPPLPGNVKGGDDVGEPPVLIMGRIVGELLEYLPLEHVPLAVQPGVPQPPGQGLQLPQIVRLGPQQSPVVRDLGGDEHIVLRVFSGLKAPVDEQTLDVAVARSAGVAGVIQPLGKSVDAPETGRELPHPLLLQLGGLVQEDHVVFRALIAVHVAVGGAVAKVQHAAVGERKLPCRGPVLRQIGQLPAKKADVIGFQLLVGPAHQQQPDARIPQGQELGLGADGPAFAAAPGPAEGHIFFLARQKLPLTGIGAADGEDFLRHTLQSSVSSSSTTRRGLPPGCCPSRVC